MTTSMLPKKDWSAQARRALSPTEIVTRLADEVTQALKSPDVVASLAAQGAAPGSLVTTQFSDYVKAEVTKKLPARDPTEK